MMCVCVCGKSIEVLKSGAGYYLGAVEMDEELHCPMPYCRVSGYYRTAQEAQEALSKGFTERRCMENAWCASKAGAYSCFDEGE